MKWMCALVVMMFMQENERPKVTIVAPAGSSSYQWGTSLRFEVHVADKEDGDSKYDELNTAEILVEARAMADTSQLADYRKTREPLQAMMSSNCLNCHTFHSKLIGPSFVDISTKRKNADELVQHVKDGSKGVWGDVVMPSHPELAVQQIEMMVHWIMQFAEQKDVEYTSGTSGSLRLQKPATKKSKLLLTAAYLDHQKLPGEAHVVLDVKE